MELLMSELLDLADRVAGWARAGEEVEAYVARAHDTDVRVFDGDVESLSSAQTEGVGVRVVAGHRQGFAYAGSLDEASLREALADARDNAGFGTVDEFLGVPQPDGVAAAHLDLFREELAGFSTDHKVELALELDRAVRAADPRIRGVETAEYGDASIEAAIASTTGGRAYARRTTCSLYAYAIAGEGAETQTGYGWSIGRAPEDLDVGRAAGMAAERATRLLGATKPASRRVTAVLDPMVTASFLGVLSGALSGESVLKGRSLFAGREGEQVAVPGLTLTDDPTSPDARGATPYDAEGLATRRNVLIENGVLRGFVHNAYTGRRSGAASTGSAVRAGFKSTPGVGTRALALVPGERTQRELLSDIGDGLLVLSVQGLHSGANPVSGDFSVGCEGLVIRDGVAAEPVREATIASTLQRMLLDVVGVGSDLEWLPGGAAGLTLAIRDVTLSGA
jgi:PmbA protein